MAVYIPAGKRRRRIAAAIVAGVVVGVIVGLVIGRATAPGLSDGVKKARTKAGQVTDTLSSLPVEYQGMLSGDAGKTQAVFDASLDRLNGQLDEAIAKASWFGPSAKQRLHAALAKVRADADARVSSTQFGADLTAASKVVDDEFGIPGNGA